MARQPKVAIYVRVSTDEQNPDAQLRDLREYVRSRGWKNVTEYVDLGFSGAKDSRPKWNELWDAVQKGRVHVLVTHALDRLGRSLAHLVKIIFTLTERNVTLVSFRENIDLSTAQGRLIASIFAVLAEYELSMIRERTRAGMRAAKARGSKIGNQKRFFDKKKAIQLRDQGYGQIRIARKLGIGVGRVNRWVKQEYLPPEKRARLNGTVGCGSPPG
ncbi:MAG: recombinase family protein [Planctomycetes bacterium]|nr:recombinase family protein [Planctomycetota bacterium]